MHGKALVVEWDFIDLSHTCIYYNVTDHIYDYVNNNVSCFNSVLMTVNQNEINQYQFLEVFASFNFKKKF